MEKQDNARGTLATGATRALAVVGFLAVIIIGMWGSVKVAQAVPGTLSAIANVIVSISSIFVPSTETITLSAPSLSVTSGTPVTLSFVHNKNNPNGTYNFRYSCVDGVTFNVVSAGGANVAVTCNTPYPALVTNNTMTVTPISSTNRFVDVEVFVSFTPAGAATATVTGSTVLTIENQSVTGSPTTTNTNPPVVTTPKPKPVTPGTQTTGTYPITGTGPGVSNPNGFVDLTARVIETGTIDKDTGVFTANAAPDRNPVGARVAVRFAIENVGTKTSPQFTFNAMLPTLPPYTFFSDSQVALAPGDRIEFTIGFDSFQKNGPGEFIINVDPTGGINEKNKTNNVVHYTVNVVN